MNHLTQEIFNNGTAVVHFYIDLKLLKVSWLTKIALDSEAYRKPFLFCIEYASKTACVLFLSDIREQGVVPVTEKQWFRDVVFPKAASLGVKFGAVITSANVFKTYYMNAIIKIGSVFNLPVKTFNDEKKAMDWLINQNAHI